MPFDGEMLIETDYMKGVRELTFRDGRLASALDGEAAVDRIFQRARSADSPLVSASDIELWTEKLKAFGHRPHVMASTRDARRASETCLIEVVADASLIEGLKAFTIYVNGNIRGPRSGFRSKSQDQQRILPFEPGAYRIVLRGKDIHDPHRLESNTLHFNIASGDRLKLVTRMQGHALVIEIMRSSATK